MRDFKLDLPELSEEDSALIQQTYERHTKQDAFDVDKWLAELAEHAQGKAAETKKAKGKHHGI